MSARVVTVLICLVLSPFVLAVYQLLAVTGQNIHQLERKREGLTLHGNMLELMIAIALERGALHAYFSGEDAFGASVRQEKDNIESLLTHIPSLHQQYGWALPDREQWTAFVRQWERRKDVSSVMDADRSFEAYTGYVDELILLMRKNADVSGLVGADLLGEHYLMDMVVVRVPAIADHIGQLRGWGTRYLALGHFTLDNKRKLVTIHSELQRELKHLAYNLDVIASSDPAVTIKLSHITAIAEPKMREFSGELEDIYAGDLSMDAEEFFVLGTQATNAYNELGRAASALLRNQFDQRIGSMHQRRLAIVVISALIVCAMVVAGVLYRRADQRRRVAQGALHQSEQRFKLAVEGTRDGVWDWPDMSKDEEYWSPQWKALLGYADHEIEASASAFFSMLHPDDQPRVQHERDRCIAEGTFFDSEYRLRTKFGEYRWFGAKGIITDAEGIDIRRMTGSMTDIHARKEAEVAMEQATHELMHSNEELERFAYLASHDLQEPLRMVTNFTGLLAARYRDRLDDRAMQYIDIATNAAKRMQALIQDLLDYARVKGDPGLSDEVDCSELLAYVLTNLEARIHARQAVITHGDLPVITSNRARFASLLQNLISNGIKYCRPDVIPTVHVTAQEAEREWLFAVQDNGIGMKPEYCAQIFLPFKRLHTKEEYEGTGMGLAICKKIVDSFGGRIWVDSREGEGSTFYFTVSRDTEPIETEETV